MRNKINYDAQTICNEWEWDTAGKESFLSSLLRTDILMDCWAVDICP
ncbi:hypothetical protein [Paenibacillus sp. CFBP13512]|nr:hypothetical protein [Paenibacillus sp. CFBP13512]